MAPPVRRAALFALLLLGGVASSARAQSTVAGSPGGSTLSTVLVCATATSSQTPSPNCPPDANGNPQAVATVQGYVLNASDYTAFQLASAPIDLAFAGSCFAIGFATVVGCWWAGFFVAVARKGASMLS